MNTADAKAILEKFIELISYIEEEQYFAFSVEYIPDKIYVEGERKEGKIVYESENEIIE